MDQQPPRRNSFGTAILAVLVVAGSAVGVMIYQFSQKKPSVDPAGFDISKTQEVKPASNAGASQPPSSGALTENRTMIKAGDMGQIRVGESGGTAQPGHGPGANAPDNFTDAVRKSEGKIKALAEAYTKRYPSVARYGQDWMSYPDLKQLNDDYMSKHDPVAFLRGVSRSKNFAKLIVKYAGDPAIQSFVKTGVSQAPGEVTSSAMNLLKEDSAIKTVVSNVASALGLPPMLTAGILNGGKVDQNQVMGQVMQGTPGLQGAMQDPEVQKAMQKQGLNH